MHICSPGTWWWRQEDSRASLLPSKFQASWLTQDLYNIKNKRGKVWETCLGAFLVPLPADFCGLDVFGIAAADLDEIRFSFSPVAPKGFLPFPVFLCMQCVILLGAARTDQPKWSSSLFRWRACSAVGDEELVNPWDFPNVLVVMVCLTASVSCRAFQSLLSCYSHPEPWVSSLNFHRELTERDFLKFNIQSLENKSDKSRKRWNHFVGK